MASVEERNGDFVMEKEMLEIFIYIKMSRDGFSFLLLVFFSLNPYKHKREQCFFKKPTTSNGPYDNFLLKLAKQV